MNRPRAQIAEDINMGGDQREEESGGFNKDILENPHNDAATNTVNEEEELKIEKAQLEQSFEVGQASTKRKSVNLVSSEFEITIYFVYFEILSSKTFTDSCLKSGYYL